MLHLFIEEVQEALEASFNSSASRSFILPNSLNFEKWLNLTVVKVESSFKKVHDVASRSIPLEMFNNAWRNCHSNWSISIGAVTKELMHHCCRFYNCGRWCVKFYNYSCWNCCTVDLLHGFRKCFWRCLFVLVIESSRVYGIVWPFLFNLHCLYSCSRIHWMGSLIKRMFLLLIMCAFFLVFLVPVYKWFLCNCDNPLLIPGSAWSSKFWCAAWHFWQAWHSSWFPIIYECVRLLQLKHWPICAQTLYGCDILWCVDFNTLSGRTVRVAALIVYQTLLCK